MTHPAQSVGGVTVITYGTFDLFHVGHLNLLRRLRARCDRLVVGVSTDEFNALKGKKTVIPYAQRAEIVSAIRHVDKVIAEQSWMQKRSDIVRECATVFAMGSDWEGRFDDLTDLCQVLYLPRTECISSTEVKERVVSSSLHAARPDARPGLAPRALAA